jgi:hypothetical protein
MKNFGLTLLMMLFIGVGTSMAQDKKAAADSDAAAAAPVKTEQVAKDHACEPGCAKACCAKDAHGSAHGKKACTGEAKAACAPGCEKKCCTADAGKATKETAPKE